MTVRAKFFCQSIQKAEDDSYRTIHMSPVTADTEENKTWSKYTPGGQLMMHVSNPAAFEQFEQGIEYFIDIQPAQQLLQSSLTGGLDNGYFPKGKIVLKALRITMGLDNLNISLISKDPTQSK